MRASHNDLQYFDLLFLLGRSAYDFPFMYLLFFMMHLVQEFFDELQDSALLKISSPKTVFVSCVLRFSHCAMRNVFKIKFFKQLGLLHALLVFWYFLTTFMFYPTRWNILDWTLENYYKALQSACELYFNVPVQTAKLTPFYALFAIDPRDVFNHHVSVQHVPEGRHTFVYRSAHYEAHYG